MYVFAKFVARCKNDIHAILNLLRDYNAIKVTQVFSKKALILNDCFAYLQNSKSHKKSTAKCVDATD